MIGEGCEKKPFNAHLKIGLYASLCYFGVIALAWHSVSLYYIMLHQNEIADYIVALHTTLHCLQS